MILFFNLQMWLYYDVTVSTGGGGVETERDNFRKVFKYHTDIFVERGNLP